MEELEPRTGEGVGKDFGVLVEVFGDLTVCRVSDHGHVCRGHHGGNLGGSVFCIRGHVGLFLVRRSPLVGSGWTLGQCPRVFVLEQHVEVTVVPLNGVGRPGTFDTARDGVTTDTRAIVAGPSKTLFFEGCPFWFGAFVVFWTCTVSFTERVAASGESNGFFVVHRHSAEGFTDILCAKKRVRVRVGSLWVHVYEPHLDRCERVFKVLACLTVTVVTKPLVFAAPIDVIFRVPNVGSTAAKPEDRTAHGFDGDLAGENQQVCPTNGVAILLFDGPQEAAGFVEVAVVWPAVEWSEALSPCSATTTTVSSAVCTCSVPGHSDEERPVVPIVSRPPVLTVGHQCVKVLLQPFIIE